MQSVSAAPRKAALAFIFVTVMLDILALGMVIPVLPKLLVRFLSGDTARAAIVFGMFVSAFELMQFVFSPVLGVLSDRFGRRPIVLLSNLGLGLDYVFMAAAPSLLLLFVGRVIAGVTSASFAVAGAYIADVMPPEKRAAGFGMLGAAFGIGFVVGPALGGVLGKLNPTFPFWAAATLSLVNAMYGFLVLPESLAREHRVPFEWKRANPFGSFVLLRTHKELLGLACATFAANLGHFVLQSTFVLYAGYRYHWDERAVGLALGGVGVCSAVVQAGLVGVVVEKIGERATLIVGLFCGALGFAIYGFAPTGRWFCLGIPVMALWGLSGPSAQTLMTRRIGPSEQGQLQGASASIAAIAGIVAPGIFAKAFSVAIEPHSPFPFVGAPFFVATLFLFVALGIAVRVTRGGDAGVSHT